MSYLRQPFGYGGGGLLQRGATENRSKNRKRGKPGVRPA